MTDNLLAQLSSDAYNDDIQLLGYHTSTFFDKKTNTTCFVLSNELEQIVVFRGTKVSLTNFKNMITNLKVKPIHDIHGGFLEAFNSVSKSLDIALDPRKPTIFTGHSLGGALAQIAHTFFVFANSRCVVFGSPRVFTDALARVFDRMEGKRIIRYESPADPVPFAPPYSMGYRHIGTLIGNASFIDLLTTNKDTKLKAHSIENYILTLNELRDNND